MHQSTAALPAEIETPDASIQRLPEFGSIDGREFDVVRAKMGPGVDTTPLLEGLEDDLCQVPHWGYVVDGTVTVRYADGAEEVARAGEAVHWPPGHTIFTPDEGSGAEVVLFSPRHEHRGVLDHLQRKLAGSTEA